MCGHASTAQVIWGEGLCFFFLNDTEKKRVGRPGFFFFFVWSGVILTCAHRTRRGTPAPAALYQTMALPRNPCGYLGVGLPPVWGANVH